MTPWAARPWTGSGSEASLESQVDPLEDLQPPEGLVEPLDPEDGPAGNCLGCNGSGWVKPALAAELELAAEGRQLRTEATDMTGLARLAGLIGKCRDGFGWRDGKER